MGWFTSGLAGFLAGEIDADAHKLKLYLLDCTNAGPAAGAWKVTGATYSAPYVTITTSAAHGLTASDPVEVFSVAGISNVNGEWTVFDAPTTTTFRYQPSGTPAGTYTATSGYIIDLSISTENQFNVASNSVIATIEVPTSGRSTANGVLDLPDSTFTSVVHPGSGTVQAWALLKTGTTPGGADDAASSRRLILCQTPASPGLTGLPATPNNTNLNLLFSAQGVGRI